MCEHIHVKCSRERLGPMAAGRVAGIAMLEDPSTLSIKELKAILAQHGVDSSGCLEKRDLIHLLEQAQPSKRQKSAPDTSAIFIDTPPRPLDTIALLHSAHLSRLLSVLPPEERRPREPDPQRLCDEHTVPPVAGHQLRVCTFNLLDDVRVKMGHGGIHAVWDMRRINVLRCLLAMDADVYLLQELNAKSIDFLRATLGSEYTLVPFSETAGGVGIMYRAVPPPADARRAVYLTPAGASYKRNLIAPSASASERLRPGSCLGIAIHVPLVVHGMAPTAASMPAVVGASSASPPAAPAPHAAYGVDQPLHPFRIVASSVHLTPMDKNGHLHSCNREARYFGAALGRDLLRLPAAHGHCPMILGGDFNAGTHGKRATANSGSDGSGGGPPSLHAELTRAMQRRPDGRSPDSDDEWPEDSDVANDDQALRWPPPGKVTLARDLFRDSKLREREFGGLQRGSTCCSVHLQNFEGRLQGVAARAANEEWHEKWPKGECTDEGHIDWLLASMAHGDKTQPQLRARRALVCTERLCAPLPPHQPSHLVGPGGDHIPKGGAVFPSDHYPVVVDLELDLDAPESARQPVATGVASQNTSDREQRAVVR